MENILSSLLNCSQLELRGNELWYVPTHPPANERQSDDDDDVPDLSGKRWSYLCWYMFCY